MSTNQPLLDKYKPWYNERVNNLIVDGDIIRGEFNNYEVINTQLMSNANTTPKPITVDYVNNNGVVTLHFPLLTITPAEQSALQGRLRIEGLPPAVRDVQELIVVQDGDGTLSIGQVQFDTPGTMSIYKDINMGLFTPGANTIGVVEYPLTLTYLAAI